MAARNRVSKRGQLKMFETIAVLIVFFFLLAFVAVFYMSAQRSSIEKEGIRLQEGLALQTVFKALYMPELDCTFLLGQRDNCIDVLKLDAMERLMENETIKREYFEEFGQSSISVQQVYPQVLPVRMLYSSVPEEKATERVTHSPVLLYDGRTDSYAFGVIEVRVYG